MITLPEDLQPFAATLKALEERLADVRSHLTRARSDHDHAAVRSDADLAELGEQEANRVLDGAAAPEKLRELVYAAQSVMVMLAARVRGLEAREVQLGEEIRAARQEFQAAKQAWSQSEVAKARDRVRALALKFTENLAEPLAIGRGHGDITLDAMMRYAKLTTVGTGSDLFLPVSSHAWRENPVMMEVVSQHAAILDACDRATRAQ